MAEAALTNPEKLERLLKLKLKVLQSKEFDDIERAFLIDRIQMRIIEINELLNQQS